jgi:uncharacterized protein (DUF1684 family)
MRHLSLIVLGTAGLLSGCAEPPPPPPAPSVETHRAAVEEWHARRTGGLVQPVGWLSLAGLHWRESGRTTFGSDSANDFAYDPPGRSLPPSIGAFVRTGMAVRFEPEPGVPIRAGDEAAHSPLMMESTGQATTLSVDALVWRIIQRDDRIAVRLWDTASVSRTSFQGIDRFPVDIAWRFAARFIAHDPPDTVEVPTVLGTINHTPSPGSVEFEYHGEPYRLMLWKDSDDLSNFFTAFGDRTNGALTYGGGRFLWVDAPDGDGWTVVDFNRSYNPPCVFTEFATCPLAPRPNRLPFAVQAGERVFNAGH